MRENYIYNFQFAIAKKLYTQVKTFLTRILIQQYS